MNICLTKYRIKSKYSRVRWNFILMRFNCTTFKQPFQCEQKSEKRLTNDVFMVLLSSIKWKAYCAMCPILQQLHVECCVTIYKEYICSHIILTHAIVLITPICSFAISNWTVFKAPVISKQSQGLLAVPFCLGWHLFEGSPYFLFYLFLFIYFIITATTMRWF